MKLMIREYSIINGEVSNVISTSEKEIKRSLPVKIIKIGSSEDNDIVLNQTTGYFHFLYIGKLQGIISCENKKIYYENKGANVTKFLANNVKLASTNFIELSSGKNELKTSGCRLLFLPPAPQRIQSTMSSEDQEKQLLTGVSLYIRFDIEFLTIVEEPIYWGELKRPLREHKYSLVPKIEIGPNKEVKFPVDVGEILLVPVFASAPKLSFKLVKNLPYTMRVTPLDGSMRIYIPREDRIKLEGNERITIVDKKNNGIAIDVQYH